MATSTLTLRHLYAGTPNTTRGEPSRLSVHPTKPSITYPSGRVAIVRSLLDPLSSRSFALHAATVTCARFSPCGSWIASADDSGVIRVWNPNTGAQKYEIDAMSAAIRDVVFSTDAKYIVAVGDSRGAYGKVLKVQSGGTAGVCLGHTKRAVACDIGHNMVATASEDMTVGLFKGPPVREIDPKIFFRHPQGFVNDVRFSHDGALLAVASSDRTATVLDVKTEHVLVTLNHAASVTGVAWMSDSRLLTSSNDKTCCIWTIPEGKCIHKYEYGSNVMDMQTACALSKQGHLVSVSLRPQINVIDTNTNAKHILRGHAKQIIGLATVANNMYTADYSGLMVSWKLDSGSCSDKPFNGKGPATSVCALAANHHVVANCGQDGKVYITPRDTLAYNKPLVVKGGGVDIAVPSDLSVLAAVMINESRAAAVSTDGSELLAELPFQRGERGCCVAVSSDASVIAMGFEVSGAAGELRFYTLTANALEKCGETIRMPSAPNRISFSPDMKLIAVGEKSRRVKLYSVETRRMMKGGGLLHTARVDAIAFSDDGARVVSGGMDGSLAVWTLEGDAEPVSVKSAHRNGVTGVGFVPGGVASAGGDGCVRTWNLE